MRDFKLDIVLVLTLGLAAGEWLAYRLLSRANLLITPLLARAGRGWTRHRFGDGELSADWPGLSADAY